MLDFLALETFLAIGETGSVTAAAQRLNCVQSAVTARLRKLEDGLGATLAERHARGVTLTEAGERLMCYARRIARLAEEAEGAVTHAARTEDRLRLGTMETTAAARLPRILARLRADAPELRLSLATGPSDHLTREVLAGRLDAALIGGRIEHPELSLRPVLTEELVEAQAPGLGDMAKRTLLAFRRGCSYRARAEAWLRHDRRAPFEVMEFGSLDAILGCAEAGLGIAVLPRVTVEGRAPALALADLPPTFARLETCLIARADTPPPPVLNRLCAALAG
ncbi:Transcriptional regulator, LysR family [uncultured Alphaproteobacteria bacterium]|uniref:Transcriptional regulator, LysR family n=1 Tax=uncultured Alphaproteobacteria bacterium TaxID=91750 RepID=A0A212K697_9PROT|nr:Transcriptional regulator, LysR family [uncultured Alphaproteobacteria bacterium]